MTAALQLADDLRSYLAPSGLPYLSVSQVETALGQEGCLFKWGQRYLARNKPPRDGSADLGSRVHELNEMFMATGAEPIRSERMTLRHKRRQIDITYAPGEIWASGKHLLPPRHLVQCEGHFRFSTSIHGAPVYWQGAKDMEWQDEQGLWHIGDLKTTVSFQYQKTADKLRRDWQGNLYAFEAMQRLGVTVVQLDWFTFITDPDKPRECRPTSILALWPEVYEVVRGLEEKGLVLLSHYRNRQAFPGLPKNRGVPCTAFGGCPYRDTPACPEPTLDELFEGDQKMSNVYEDFLGNMNRIVPATPPPPVVLPMPKPFTKPWAPGDPLNDTQKFLEAAKAPLATIANAADVPPSADVALSYKDTPPVNVRPQVESGFINPQEAKGPAPITPDELEAAPAPSSVQKAPVPDNLDALDRDGLKPLGMELGLWDADCRWQAPRMRDAIRAEVRSKGVAAVPFLATPAPTAPAHLINADLISEETIRRIVREELRALFTHV